MAAVTHGFAAVSVAFATSQPNVLFIAIDDLRPELGCYGAEHVISPHMDAFGKSGVVFERAYCQQAVCNPSRSSLMTGLRPDTIGVTGNHAHFRKHHPQVVTLPQLFKNHGYHAQSIGIIYHGVFPDGASKTKWDTMGDPESWSTPTTRFGPRYYYTEDGIRQAKRSFQITYRPQDLTSDEWTNKLVFGPMTESPEVPDNTLYDGKVADAAVATLAELKTTGKPFFLAVGFIKPHTPFVAPKKYYDLYDPKKIQLASNPKFPTHAPGVAGHGSHEVRRYTDQPKQGEFTVANQRRLRHGYLACISYVDAQIGRVLSALEANELDYNTVVVLFGDHGWHLGEHGLWGKTTNFELDARAPLIVRAPGRKAKGKKSTRLVEFVDIYPTLAELAGLAAPANLQGTSFVPLLANPVQEWKTAAFSQFPRGDKMGYSMRTDRWRYTEWVGRSNRKIAARELYDHESDAAETINVAGVAANSALVSQLSKKLAGSRKLRSIQTTRIRVACIGDSITYGSGIDDRERESYPARLQQLLGDKYDVQNFGRPGADVLAINTGPYAKTKLHREALAFNPDIVISNLGINDVHLIAEHSQEFADDYIALLKQYASLQSDPVIHLWSELPPIMPGQKYHKKYLAVKELYCSQLGQVAEVTKAGRIDMHSPLAEHPEWFPDNLHPNATGAAVVARTVASEIAPSATKFQLVAHEKENKALSTGDEGFEGAPSGTLTELATPAGTWAATAGQAEIDDSHARSGKQCLHILGGANKQVEFVPQTHNQNSGLVTFWAERWTSRSPFEFRVEQQCIGKWVEVYNGDEKIRVGGFRTQVNIPLQSGAEAKLRIRTNTPINSGVLIDDVAITKVMPMKVVAATAEQPTLPALLGTEASPISRLKIDVSGNAGVAPVVKSISLSTTGTTNLADVESVELYFTGNTAAVNARGNANAFTGATQFGSSQSVADELRFKGKRALIPGENYFWVAFKLKKHASIDRRVKAVVTGVTMENDSHLKVKDAFRRQGQRMGVAVRQRGDDGVHTYRIPGLATTNEGTLIGVYDVRRRSGGDLPGDIDVGMSRSTDGGQSWEPMQLVMDMGSDPKWRYDGIGDPTVLVDRESNTVWIAGVWSHGNRGWAGSGPGLMPKQTGQLMLVRSDDDGLTWSKPINITKQLKKPEWCFLLQGPGKGFTMLDGTLVLPAQYQDTPENKRLPRSAFVYSRDHGATWRIATGAFDDTTEAQVVELTRGELMINCRFNREPYRVVMTTTNMGADWHIHPTSRKALIEPGTCMASLIHVDRELGAESGSRLLFSNPNSLHGRQRMTIKFSPDHGNTWPEELQVLLDEFPSAGYSCMSMVDSETVGILYEGSQAHMTFQRVPLAEIAGE